MEYTNFKLFQEKISPNTGRTYSRFIVIKLRQKNTWKVLLGVFSGGVDQTILILNIT